MSTSGSSRTSQRLAELPADECPLCLQKIADPRLLICLHSFCRDCIDRMLITAPILDSSRKTVHCPLCRTQSVIPEGGASFLPKDYTRIFSRGANTELVCQFCDGKDKRQAPTVWCHNCRMALCDNHLVGHVKQSPDSKGGCLVKPLKHPAFAEDHTGMQGRECDVHGRRRELIYFCMDCKTAVCSDCALFQHKGHEHVAVEDAIIQQRERVCAELQKLAGSVLPDLQPPLASVERVVAKLDARMERVRDEIRAAEGRVVQEVRTQAEQMLQEVYDMKQERFKPLENKRSELRDQVAGVKNAIVFGKKLLEEQPITEKMIPLMQAFERRSVSLCHDDCANLPPLPHGNFSVQSPKKESLVASVKASLGAIHWLQASSSNSYIDLPSQEVTEGQTGRFILRTVDADNQPVPASNEDEVTVQTISTPADVILPMSVTHGADGEYILSCTPVVEGDYQFEVSINEEKMSTLLYLKCLKESKKSKDNATTPVVWQFDPLECDSCIELSAENRIATRTPSIEGTYPSVLGMTGMRHGQHTWKMQLLGAPVLHIVGVAPKPLGSTRGNHTKTYSWHGSSLPMAATNVQWFGQWMDKDTLQFDLDCDRHILNVTNLRSGETDTYSSLPDEELFPYFCARVARNVAKFVS